MAGSNLKTLAYTQIRRKIVSCEYAPGSNLNEEILTSALGLSRTPVRDALGRLEQEGLVEIRPKKGVTVTPLTVTDINMIFELRRLYEPFILENYGHLLPAERLNEFYQIFQTPPEDGFESERSSLAFYDLDEDFHLMIVQSCPNIYIRRSYEMIRTQNERFRHMTAATYVKRLEDSYTEHLEILRACLAQDWKEAAERMRIHIEKSRVAAVDRAFEYMKRIAE